MTARRAAVGAVLVVLALVTQAAVVARLPLPGGSPDLVLVLVVAVGLLRGPAAGALLGFGAGVAVDLLTVQALGTAALVLCLTGWLAGVVAGEATRSAGSSLVTVGVLSAVAGLGLAAVLLLTGQPHAGPAALLERAAVTAVYDVAVAPIMLAALAPAVRRPVRERVR